MRNRSNSSFAQAQGGGFERQLVADGPQAEYAADRDVGKIRSMPKLFTRENIAQVYLDERYGDAEQGIAQRDARMGKCARIEEYQFHGVLLRAMDLRDQFVFGIALQAQQLDLARSCSRDSMSCSVEAP